MASRPVRTNELRAKYRMAQPQVLAVLKKAKVKPTDKIDMGGRGVSLMWPNREANAALRAFRVENPANRMRGTAPKRTTSRTTQVISNIETFRENKRIDGLIKRVEELTATVAQLNMMLQSKQKVN